MKGHRRFEPTTVRKEEIHTKVGNGLLMWTILIDAFGGQTSRDLGLDWNGNLTPTEIALQTKEDLNEDKSVTTPWSGSLTRSIPINLVAYYAYSFVDVHVSFDIVGCRLARNLNNRLLPVGEVGAHHSSKKLSNQPDGLVDQGFTQWAGANFF